MIDLINSSEGTILNNNKMIALVDELDLHAEKEMIEFNKSQSQPEKHVELLIDFNGDDSQSSLLA